MLMSSIYAQAERVAIWLGEHSDDSEHAMNIMAELHTKITGNDGLSTFDGLITNLLEAKLEIYEPPSSSSYKS